MIRVKRTNHPTKVSGIKLLLALPADAARFTPPVPVVPATLVVAHVLAPATVPVFLELATLAFLVVAVAALVVLAPATVPVVVPVVTGALDLTVKYLVLDTLLAGVGLTTTTPYWPALAKSYSLVCNINRFELA